MKIIIILCGLLISLQSVAEPRFVQASPLNAARYEVQAAALCATAKETLAYLNRGAAYDPSVIHEGRVFKLPLARVKASLEFICQHQNQMQDPKFIQQHFEFYRWYPDLAQAKAVANKPLIANLPKDKILMTKYYVHRAQASAKESAVYPFALYALPQDEANLTLEQANAKPGLTRFHYGKQAILKGALAHKNVPVLAYVNRNDLEAALMQGTVVAEINRQEKIFNVHRTNNIAYDKTKNPLAQERYWYFKQVDGIKGYGKDAEHKITVNTQVTFAADLQKFGLGKLLMVQYPESTGALISRVGILADTGGAFVNNQYQVDFLSGTYAGPEAFYKANRGIPDYVVAYFMVLKDETSSALRAPSARLAQGRCVAQPIHKMPIQFDEERIALTRDYQLTHYGIKSKSIEIEPKMIVLHWTSIESLATTWRIFNPPTFPENSPRAKELPGTLNVSSHFLVDRDGSIYQLMPENWMARHTIGLNHYAIGIENVGGKDAQDDLTDAQVKANAFLVCYLKKKYPKIDYVIGHNTYLNFKNTALWLEKDPNYQTDKYDPGPDFVNKVLGLLALNT